MIVLSLPNSLERGLLALAIIAGGLLVYSAMNRLILARAQSNAVRSGAGDERGSSPFPDLPEDWRGVPAILYFTTPDCAACKAVQRPALNHLQTKLGDALQVIEIDAVERPDLASRWGVLSVPTTFIISPDGRLRHVNHGATRADKLARQLMG